MFRREMIRERRLTKRSSFSKILGDTDFNERKKRSAFVADELVLDGTSTATNEIRYWRLKQVTAGHDVMTYYHIRHRLGQIFSIHRPSEAMREENRFFWSAKP